jgi:hypothetical protein
LISDVGMIARFGLGGRDVADRRLDISSDQALMLTPQLLQERWDTRQHVSPCPRLRANSNRSLRRSLDIGQLVKRLVQRVKAVRRLGVRRQCHAAGVESRERLAEVSRHPVVRFTNEQVHRQRGYDPHPRGRLAARV